MKVVLLFATAIVVALAGCEGCEGEAPAGGGGGGGSATSKNRPQTEDGYEIIHARPPQKGPRPSRPGEARAEREREQLVREPTSPDPHAGRFTLEQAVDGLGEATEGTLLAEIKTDLGTIFCDLYADEVPSSVAHFIGLARGNRAWWDARSAAWVRRPMYNRTLFHRVIPDYLIQGGDYLGDGTGTIGFTLPDETRQGGQERVHDRPGQLCLAAEGENRNGGQWFITDGPAAGLDSEEANYTIIGQCRPEQIISNIARVPQGEENRPITDTMIVRVIIRRVRGGAAQARVTPPVPESEGFDPTVQPRNASPGPSELAIPGRAPEDVELPESLQRAREAAEKARQDHIREIEERTRQLNPPGNR
jgi:peptidyl-prolyl cis-trans isomerase A (cyclophilin A)